jgi:hypothetical protein
MEFCFSLYIVSGATRCISCQNGYSSGVEVEFLVPATTFFLINFGAGIQVNSSLAFCIPSETIVIVVTLPMTKTEFFAIEDKYIVSVATTANVIRENVKVISIDEISTRSFRMILGRVLLATSVHVQTSVLVGAGQQTLTDINFQSELNRNLNKNGIPSGSLVVQYKKVASVDITTPAPDLVCLGGTVAEGMTRSAAASNFPVGAVIGGSVGFAVLLGITVLAFVCRKRLRKLPKACPWPVGLGC